MRKRPIIILLCLYLFHIISNYIWLKIDKSYLLFDAADYHINSLILFEVLKNSPLSLLSAKLFSVVGKSGLFVELFTACFYFIFGTSQDAAVMINSSIFLGVLLFSIYGIGKKIHNERTALLSVFIVSMYPAVFNHLRLYMFDLPLSAFVSLNIYLLLRSNNFKNRTFSILYGLVTGLGLLTKFNLLAFIIGPILLVFYNNLRQAGKKTSSRLKRQSLVFGLKPGNILREKKFNTALVTIIIMTLIFGIHSLRLMLSHSFGILWIRNLGMSGGSFGDKIISLSILWFYSFLIFTVSVINESLSLFFLLIFVIGLLIILKIRFKYTALLLLPILIPFFLLIFIFNTVGFTARYMLPGYIFVALISSVGIMNIRSSYIKKAIVVFILAFGLMQYFAVSYGCNFLPREIKIDLPSSIVKRPSFLKSVSYLKQEFAYADSASFLKNVAFFKQNLPLFNYRVSSQPQNDYEIINKIMNIYPSGKGCSIIFLDFRSDIGEILYPLKFEVFNKTKTMDNIKEPFFLEYDTPPNKYIPVCNYIQTIDYVAIAEGIPEDSGLRFLPYLKAEIQKTRRYFYDHLYLFDLAGKIELSDRRTLSIYRNKSNNIIAGPLAVKIRNAGVAIFYRGKEITGNSGLTGYCRYKQKDYFLEKAIWDIQRPDSNYILAYAKWPEFELTQMWELRLQDGHVDYKVYLDNPKRLFLQDFGIQLQFSPFYQNWRDKFKTGRFPKILPLPSDSQEIKTEAFLCNIVTIEPVKSPEGKLPGLLFRDLNDGYPKQITLYSTERAHIFNVSSVFTPKIEPTKNKPSLISSGQISLFTNNEEVKQVLKEGVYPVPSTFLKQGPLELFFILGRGDVVIYYKNKRITAGAGLNMCYKFAGSFYGSDELTWEIDKPTQNKLILKGLFSDLPFIQIWQLELSENNIINWQIEMEVKKKFEIEQGPYVNLILSDNYKRWLTLNKRGIFLPVFPWQKKWSWLDRPSSSIYIGVQKSSRAKDSLPGILLKIAQGLILDYTVPQNAGYLMRARALDIQREKDMKEPLELDIGKHKIFSGQIIVFKEDKDMDLFLKTDKK